MISSGRLTRLPSASVKGGRPIIPGEVGWARYNAKPPGDTPWARKHQDMPSLFRVYARSDEDFPRIPEKKILRALQTLFRPDEVRKDMGLVEAPDGQIGTRLLLDYMLGGSQLGSFWRRTDMRTPSHMHGSSDTMMRAAGCHISFWEIAHMRLPYRLRFDTDVILFQAFTQGLGLEEYRNVVHLDEEMVEQFSPERRCEGLRKLVSDPWFQFMLVAPFMSQFGVNFPGKGFSDSILRMERILYHPYSASLPEIEYIQSFPVYDLAKTRMLRCRRPLMDLPVQPAGHWYYPHDNQITRRTPLVNWAIWKRGRTQPLAENPDFTPRTF